MYLFVYDTGVFITLIYFLVFFIGFKTIRDCMAALVCMQVSGTARRYDANSILQNVYYITIYIRYTKIVYNKFVHCLKHKITLKIKKN